MKYDSKSGGLLMEFSCILRLGSFCGSKHSLAIPVSVGLGFPHGQPGLMDEYIYCLDW
jgi:hypothetical protein